MTGHRTAGLAARAPLSEQPATVHGRLLEAAHISGYTCARACDELEWLLESDRWKQAAPHCTDINAFLRTIDLSAFNLSERRPALIAKIKKLQPDASNRAIADATGTDEGTVRYHGRRSAEIPAPDSASANPDKAERKRGAEISAPNEGERAHAELAEKRARDAQRQAKEAEREAQRAANQELIDAAQPLDPEPTARYATVVVDPPWDWADEQDGDQLGRARPVYCTMGYDEIARLPVGDQADDDAHLYLWVTNRSLAKGVSLLGLWGFRYITALTWCKPTFGMGNYFRGQTEHVLFGVRGSLPLLRTDRGTWFAAPRPPRHRHSSKPDAFYRLVEECSPGPWLELFGRRARPGWAAWGAEA